MRLAHLADLHLGFRRYERLTSRGLNQREADTGLAFTRAIDGIIAAKPDAVVVAGDVFHSVRPTNSAIVLAYREFDRLRKALPDAPIVVIPGNHDTPRSTDSVTLFGLLHDLGLQVVVGNQPRWFSFPEKGVAFLAVPHAAVFVNPRPALEPIAEERYQVLIIHGDAPWAMAAASKEMEAGGAVLERSEIEAEGWSYVALGHYHVQVKVAERAWYSGALEYVSPDSWGELREEKRLGITGKGWLMVDLETGAVVRHPIEPPRRVLDLLPINASGMNAGEVDLALGNAVSAISGGLPGVVARQVVQNIPKATARLLNHARIRAWKSEAVHLLLELRHPQVENRRVGSGAPGQKRTLREILKESLEENPLPPDWDRQEFVREGLRLLDQVDTTLEEAD